MTMPKFTPGPWTCTSEGNVLAGPVDGFEPYGACGCCNSPWIVGDSKEEEIANAHLIAAAPDLYESLATAISQMEAAQECIESGRLDEALLHVCSLRHRHAACLAKARGEG